MRRLTLFLVATGAACLVAHAQTPVWVTPDVPTDVTGFPGTFEPADLVRFGAIGRGVCGGYAIVAANPDFAAAAAVPGAPICRR